MKCQKCGKEIKKVTNTKYCGNCKKEIEIQKAKERYYRNWERNKKRNRLYYRKNREKRSKDYKNWYNKNKERQKKNNLKGYYKNKHKWYSRRKTLKMLKGKDGYRPLILPSDFFKCQICGRRENLEIHHEVYPSSKKEIQKAINESNIYYLCRKHHRSLGKLEKTEKFINI